MLFPAPITTRMESSGTPKWIRTRTRKIRIPGHEDSQGDYAYSGVFSSLTYWLMYMFQAIEDAEEAE
jgi:hypothetical protein